MSQGTFSEKSFLKVTIAAAISGCLALAGGVWWVRDELDRRETKVYERVEARLTERLGGYVTRDTRYEDRIELMEKLDRIIKLAEKRR